MKTVTVEQAKQRVHAKSRLNTLQYHGGAGLTPRDHIRIGTVLIEVFGDYSVGVPMTATGQWGFAAWARVITDGRW